MNLWYSNPPLRRSVVQAILHQQPAESWYQVKAISWMLKENWLKTSKSYDLWKTWFYWINSVTPMIRQASRAMCFTPKLMESYSSLRLQEAEVASVAFWERVTMVKLISIHEDQGVKNVDKKTTSDGIVAFWTSLHNFSREGLKFIKQTLLGKVPATG